MQECRRGRDAFNILFTTMYSPLRPVCVADLRIQLIIIHYLLLRKAVVPFPCDFNL